LIVWIAVAAAIITATTYNCSPSNDRSPSNGCSPAIRHAAANCAPSVAAGPVAAASVTAASAASSHLHNLIVMSRGELGEIFRKNRSRRTHGRQSKKKRACKCCGGQLCIEFHRILPELASTAAKRPHVLRTSHLTERNDCDALAQW
jgi:hypothetical protein